MDAVLQFCILPFTQSLPRDQAISAAVEDEDEYKKVTEELKEMCKVMMTGDAKSPHMSTDIHAVRTPSPANEDTSSRVHRT